MVLSCCGLQKGGSIRQDFSDFGQNLRMIVSSNGIKAEKNITNKDIASSEYAYVVGGFYGRNEWLHVSKNFDDSWEDDEVVELPFYHYYIITFSSSVCYPTLVRQSVLNWWNILSCWQFLH